MKWKEKALAVIATALALLVAGCGVTPTPPPTPAPTQPPPTPTQPPASEVPVSAEEDVLGVWQVEGTGEEPVLLIFAKAERDFSAFTGSKEFDHGLFVVKEGQLTFVTQWKACYLCKGSYEVYVTKQEGRPVRLRFVLNGQDANAQRAATLNGKTAAWLPGALPGEVPVSTVEDMDGAWQVEGDPELARLTCGNGQFILSEKTKGAAFGGGSIEVKDGKPVFHTPIYGDGSYLVFVKRQSGQPVWLRFISTGDETDPYRVRFLHGKIFLLSAP